eukprot:986940-Alexandrium_andersonii.AAC.1
MTVQQAPPVASNPFQSRGAAPSAPAAPPAGSPSAPQDQSIDKCLAACIDSFQACGDPRLTQLAS